MYLSTKSYSHDVGLSACFRQHKADSHCNLLHGYALAINLVFAAEELDHRNWVMNFGGLKAVKRMLEDTFDHKLLVAADDPELDEICGLAALGIADVRVCKAVGCEAFAEMVYEMVDQWLQDMGHKPRVRLVSAEVREHGANSAIYMKG